MRHPANITFAEANHGSDAIPVDDMTGLFPKASITYRFDGCLEEVLTSA